VKSDSKKTENSGSPSEAEKEFHKTMAQAYSLQNKDRKSFQQWIRKENTSGWRRREDPHHNAFYVASKLPPDLYKQFYLFCEVNNFSRSTAVKYAIHFLLSSKNV
jgi:hypothetical protein